MQTPQQIREMVGAFSGGDSLTKIGRRFGISKQRVHQLLPVVEDTAIDTASADALRRAAHRLPREAKKRFLLSLGAV